MYNDQTRLGLTRATRLADEDVGAREAELAELERAIADRELLLATLRSGLRAFESRYLRAVRPKYAEVDRVEADIAEALAALDPDSEELREQARLARERADASERASDEASQDTSGCHTPSVGLKRLYRRVALQMHPDRSLDAEEVAYRHELMVEANRAYRDGDSGLLETLLAHFERGESADGERSGLRRALWQLARAERRLAEKQAKVAECLRVEKEIEAVLTAMRVKTKQWEKLHENAAILDAEEDLQALQRSWDEHGIRSHVGEAAASAVGPRAEIES